MKNGDYQWRLSGVHDIGQTGLYGKNENRYRKLSLFNRRFQIMNFSIINYYTTRIPRENCRQALSCHHTLLCKYNCHKLANFMHWLYQVNVIIEWFNPSRYVFSRLTSTSCTEIARGSGAISANDNILWLINLSMYRFWNKYDTFTFVSLKVLTTRDIQRFDEYMFALSNLYLFCRFQWIWKWDPCKSALALHSMHHHSFIVYSVYPNINSWNCML